MGWVLHMRCSLGDMRFGQPKQRLIFHGFLTFSSPDCVRNCVRLRQIALYPSETTELRWSSLD